MLWPRLATSAIAKTKTGESLEHVGEAHQHKGDPRAEISGPAIIADPCAGEAAHGRRDHGAEGGDGDVDAWGVEYPRQYIHSHRVGSKPMQPVRGLQKLRWIGIDRIIWGNERRQHTHQHSDCHNDIAGGEAGTAAAIRSAVRTEDDALPPRAEFIRHLSDARGTSRGGVSVVSIVLSILSVPLRFPSLVRHGQAGWRSPAEPNRGSNHRQTITRRHSC